MTDAERIRELEAENAELRAENAELWELCSPVQSTPEEDAFYERADAQAAADGKGTC